MIWFWAASTAAALVFYLPGVCTHTDTERKQRKARVRNILKSSKKNTIFNEHPVYWAQCFHYSIGSLTEHNLKKEIKKWHDRNLSDIINGQPKRVKIPYPWSLLCLWLSLVNLTNSPFDNVHVCANLTTETSGLKNSTGIYSHNSSANNFATANNFFNFINNYNYNCNYDFNHRK